MSKTALTIEEASFKDEDGGYDEAWIKGLSAEELINHAGNFYPYYYLNLLSLLGGSRAVEEIRSIAVESTRATLLGVREYLQSLAKLPELARRRDGGQRIAEEQVLLGLRGWDMGQIDSLLRRGKGLIFCSHHLGSFMRLPQELALRGLKVSLIIDDITYRQSHARLASIKSQLQSERAVPCKDGKISVTPENIHLLQLLNAQEKASFISIIKTLESGECIFVYVDGNTGWDGVWGNSSKLAIDFLGFPIAVKNGIPRLAAATGAAILPLVTVKGEADSGEVIFGEPIIPPPRLSAEERDAFVLRSMQAIYRLLEDHALRFIDQWNSVCFLHRWRTPPTPRDMTPPTVSEKEAIEFHLRSGKSFRINESRIAGLPVESGSALMDTKTLKIYKAPETADDLFRHLLREEGVNDAQVSALNGGLAGRQKIVTLLALLRKLEVIVAVQDSRVVTAVADSVP